MPGEEMYRWSQIPFEARPLDDDEIELARQLREMLEGAYRRFFSAALDHEHERRVPWRGFLGEDIGLLPEPRRLPRGIPRQEVDTSPETMQRLSVDGLERMKTALLLDFPEYDAHLGTSGELESRGYWMPIDVESDQGRPGETKP
jgi:hypothetical protein